MGLVAVNQINRDLELMAMEKGMIKIEFTTDEGNKAELKAPGDDKLLIDLAKVLFRKA